MDNHKRAMIHGVVQDLGERLLPGSDCYANTSQIKFIWSDGVVTRKVVVDIVLISQDSYAIRFGVESAYEDANDSRAEYFRFILVGYLQPEEVSVGAITEKMLECKRAVARIDAKQMTQWRHLSQKGV